MPTRHAAQAVPAGLAGGALWLAFHAGGFFASEIAIAAVAAAFGLAAWFVLAPRPLGGLSVWLAVAVGALTAFAVWTLASQTWSEAPARALLELDRALLYALTLALVGLAAGVPAVRRNVPRAVAGTFATIAACGLATRLLPELWPIAADVQFERLSYPLTYWNAMGAVGALAVVGCLHLASSSSERVWVRALAAAAVPVAATAGLYTFSRGALVTAPVGVIAYLLLARPRGAVPALLAILPTTGLAVAVAYGADAVVEQTAPTATGVAQGRTVAAVVVACALVAAALLVVLRGLEWAPRLPRVPRGRPLVLLCAAGLAAIVTAAAVADLPARVADQTARLDRVSRVQETGDSRQRLTQLSDNGRVDSWRVALDAFAREPLRGQGAGTYALVWAAERSIDQDVTDGHSLYLEVLAELGLVGGALIALALGALLVGSAARARGPDRQLGAVAFAVLLTWAIQAGIDWHWEMPAVTVLPLALAAAAVARREQPRDAPTPAMSRRWLPRAGVAVGLVAVALTPLSVARSQSQLDRAVAALYAGRCDAASSAAHRSIDLLSVRPEPYQVLAVCALRAGDGRASLAFIQAALERDPHNWRLHYDLAIVRATRRLDPRAALRQARRRNPGSALVATAVKRFDTDDPQAWRRYALSASLLV